MGRPHSGQRAVSPVPVDERLRRSRDRLREAGGVVTSIRLSPEAARAAQALIASGYAADRRGVIERALLEAAGRADPTRIDEVAGRAYWEALPSPMEQDEEDTAAAARHIRGILDALLILA